MPDFSARRRANHIAYRVDQRLDVERAAEVFMANDTPIEFGPGIHGIDEITYLYVREPGGHRIEINSGGWENYHTGLGADELERAPGRHDAVEEPGDAGLDDGVLAGRRGCGRRSRHAGFHSTELFVER